MERTEIKAVTLGTIDIAAVCSVGCTMITVQVSGMELCVADEACSFEAKELLLLIYGHC